MKKNNGEEEMGMKVMENRIYQGNSIRVRTLIPYAYIDRDGYVEHRFGYIARNW